MIESTGTFHDLVTTDGDVYIRDGNGEVWKVIGAGPDNPDNLSTSEVGVTIKNRHGVEAYTAKPSSHAVKILRPTAEETALAVLKAGGIGSEPIGWINHDEGEWQAPSYDDLEEKVVSGAVERITGMQYHLKTMHGIYADDFDDVPAQLKYHRELHADPAKHATVKHRHVK